MKPPHTKISYKNMEIESSYKPGMLKYDMNQDLIFVKCIQDWIACEELQVEGRKICNALAFANGYYLLKLKEPSDQYMFY